jgi:hypothetical protein
LVLPQSCFMSFKAQARPGGGALLSFWGVSGLVTIRIGTWSKMLLSAATGPTAGVGQVAVAAEGLSVMVEGIAAADSVRR